MPNDDYIEFQINRPDFRPPAEGYVRFTYSVSAGGLVLVDNSGTATPIGSETTESILIKLQGAAENPEKIGNEFLPEQLTVQGIKLADTSSVALPAWTLGRNSDGQLVLHDGSTIGGVVYYPENPLRINSQTQIPAVTESGTQQVELGRFPVTAAQAVALQSFCIRGRVKTNVAVPIADASFVGIMIGFEGGTVENSGYVQLIDVEKPTVYLWDMENFFSVPSPGVLQIYMTSTHNIKMTNTDSDTIATKRCFIEGTDLQNGNGGGVVGSAQEIILWALVTSDQARDAFYVNVDLEIIFRP